MIYTNPDFLFSNLAKRLHVMGSLLGRQTWADTRLINSFWHVIYPKYCKTQCMHCKSQAQFMNIADDLLKINQ